MNTLSNHGPQRAGDLCNTRWTMVLLARGDTPDSSVALSELCEAYWTPVYRFLRREGRNDDESRDLVQAFFERLLERNGLGAVDPENGRFRSCLLGALKHFLAERRRREHCEKRGGGLAGAGIRSAEPE